MPKKALFIDVTFYFPQWSFNQSPHSFPPENLLLFFLKFSFQNRAFYVQQEHLEYWWLMHLNEVFSQYACVTDWKIRPSFLILFTRLKT